MNSGYFPEISTSFALRLFDFDINARARVSSLGKQASFERRLGSHHQRLCTATKVPIKRGSRSIREVPSVLLREFHVRYGHCVVSSIAMTGLFTRWIISSRSSRCAEKFIAGNRGYRRSPASHSVMRRLRVTAVCASNHIWRRVNIIFERCEDSVNLRDFVSFCAVKFE